MDSTTFRASFITPIVLSLLSTCTEHRCLAFVSPRLAPEVLSSWNDVPSAVALPSSLLCRGNSFPTRHQRRQRSLLRTAAEGGDGGAGSNGGSGGGDAKAGTGGGAGMGLDGEWQVKSGQGMRARRGAGSDGFGSVPGKLPEKTRDGQDWAEWAREWREDPEGKADRLVSQWDAEAKANEGGGSQDLRSKKRKAKKKKKGKAGPSRGVVGSGFGGPVRQTKSVPKGLVVSETGGDKGDVVDWSKGQQLRETDRKENMVADWQQDAKNLESLDQSDREKLAEQLRTALGKKKKKKQKNKTKAKTSDRGVSKGFSTTATPTGGADTSAIKGRGDGRGVLASAAAAAGALTAEDVAGVSVFPSAAEGSDGAMEQLGSDGECEVGESKGAEGKRVSAGVGAEGRGKEEPLLVDADAEGDPGKKTVADGSGSVQVLPVASAAVEGGDPTVGGQQLASPGAHGIEKNGDGVPLERVMGFGKGVAVVEAATDDGACSDAGGVSAVGSTGESARDPSDEGELSPALSFGKGISLPSEEEATEGDDGDKNSPVAASETLGSGGEDDRLLRGFGRGVAFPAKADDGGM
ncbi:unnamed protein product [Ectocarpus sp. 13 AM-2016]